jgi:hypothetical protein
LSRASGTGMAVLTKLADQGPGYEVYEIVPVA